jgi:hypothetical protein
LRIGTAYIDANRNKGAWKKIKIKKKKERKKEFITHQKEKSVVFGAFRRVVPIFLDFSPNFHFATGDARCCRNAWKHRRDRLRNLNFPVFRLRRLSKRKKKKKKKKKRLVCTQ